MPGIPTKRVTRKPKTSAARKRSAATRPKSRKGGRRRPDPAALTPQQTARLLGIPLQTIRSHLQVGAPGAPTGPINLVHYAAWLVARLSARSPGAADQTADVSMIDDGH